MKKLSKLSIIGYGAGDAANNLAFTTATMFLLVYYTDVAGISAAAAGTLLLAVRSSTPSPTFSPAGTCRQRSPPSPWRSW